MPIIGYTAMKSHKENEAIYSKSIISAAVLKFWVIASSHLQSICKLDLVNIAYSS